MYTSFFPFILFRFCAHVLLFYCCALQQSESIKLFDVLISRQDILYILLDDIRHLIILLLVLMLVAHIVDCDWEVMNTANIAVSREAKT